ncbi:hypothetical protein NDU88_006059 [Pleurodeles waltl]|uniref:Uncharacterized protein n=1 Tax=Pleurodeles waltl TaxID=8319 RepID=A0AAV7QGL0_PLEWA|nr:hypothetical protein NDU88_006059 [Pleurodeles waltl]
MRSTRLRHDRHSSDSNHWDGRRDLGPLASLRHVGGGTWGAARGGGWPGLVKGPAEAVRCGEPGWPRDPRKHW